jgi:hypothetical protein
MAADPAAIVAERMVAWGIGVEGDRSEAAALLDAVREAGWRIVRIDPDDVYATFGNPGHRYHHITDEWAPETDPPVPSWVDVHLPPCGPCGLCGGPDARHRVLDAIASRLAAGEEVASVADDYGYPAEFINRIAAEWTPGAVPAEGQEPPK